MVSVFTHCHFPGYASKFECEYHPKRRRQKLPSWIGSMEVSDKELNLWRIHGHVKRPGSWATSTNRRQLVHPFSTVGHGANRGQSSGIEWQLCTGWLRPSIPPFQNANNCNHTDLAEGEKQLKRAQRHIYAVVHPQRRKFDAYGLQLPRFLSTAVGETLVSSALMLNS